MSGSLLRACTTQWACNELAGGTPDAPKVRTVTKPWDPRVSDWEPM